VLATRSRDTSPDRARARNTNTHIFRLFPRLHERALGLSQRFFALQKLLFQLLSRLFARLDRPSRGLALARPSLGLGRALPRHALVRGAHLPETDGHGVSKRILRLGERVQLGVHRRVRARVELTTLLTRATDPHPIHRSFIHSFIQSSFVIIHPSIHPLGARARRSIGRSLDRSSRSSRSSRWCPRVDRNRPRSTRTEPKPKPKPKPTGTKGGSWVFFRRSRLIHDTQTRCATPTHVRDPFRRFIEREVDRGRRRVIRAVEGKEETEDDVTCPRETASWTSSRTRVWCIVRRRSLADARRRRLDRAREFAWIAREGGRGGRSVGRFARRLFARSSSSEEEEDASRRE